MLEPRFIQHIADELSVKPHQVAKAVELLDGGATIPFLARYRKDATGGLNETQLEFIAERNRYFTSLTDRRDAVLSIIAEQGKLTDQLREEILKVSDKTALEDLYLPYKKKKRTKATVAHEKGLNPLALYIWEQDPGAAKIDEYAQIFVRPDKSVLSLEEAIEGAHHILTEMLSLDPDARKAVRDRMLEEGRITAHPTKNAEGKKTKYEAYYQFSEPVAQIPSHRFFAVLRGTKEGVLRMALEMRDERMLEELVEHYLRESGTVFEPHVRSVVKEAYERHLRPSIEHEVIGIVRDRADEEAIRVFRENAENLLLAPPAGSLPVIGIDPGMRTGCKVAVVDKHGAFLENATIFPTPPQNDIENSQAVLVALMQKHGVSAVAIGNGTGARETMTFVRATLSKLGNKESFAVLVNEAGASIYSASKTAREEFPDLDVSIRGAVSIARRLQDPLAELVKTEPRHIGVGQYQHDVNQRKLKEGLYQTVVSCVNRVGVDLNLASVSLLRYVSGIGPEIAKSIVAYREKAAVFRSRQQLLEVEGIGARVFEQCAGFLRLRDGENPLDRTGIHPEAYPIVEQIAVSFKLPVDQLIENTQSLSGVDLSGYQTDTMGPLALEDIRRELIKPSRDPRTEFKIPNFLDGVTAVADLEEGMEMEGVVTNVTDFGAFVDVGVHQDGLVHLSELANHFVRDPRDIVKVGQIVKVKVIKVDKELPRVSLSIKALLPAERKGHALRSGKHRHAHPEEAPAQQPQKEVAGAKQERPSWARSNDRAADGGGRNKRRDGRPSRRDRKDVQTRRIQPSQQQRQGDTAPLVNTQLADQLAALKEQMGKN